MLKRNKNPNIVIGGSLGGSGCSAFLDLLREVDTYYVTPQEFALFADPDGLISLESALLDNWTVFQSDLAIKRFKKLGYNLYKRFRSPYSILGYSKIFGDAFLKILNNYVNELVDFTFRGLWYGIDTLTQRQLKKYKFFQRSKLTTKDIFISKNLSEEKFLKLTKKFILNLTEICLSKYKKTDFAFDEGYAAMSPKKILRYLPPSGKIVMVIRDPRDIFAQMQLLGWIFLPERIDDFIKIQKAIFNRLNEQTREVSKDRFMQIRFEDLVLKYEETVGYIFKFLNIDNNLHSRRKTIFNPEISKKNIGLWKTKMNKEEIEKMNLGLKDILMDNGYEIDI